VRRESDSQFATDFDVEDGFGDLDIEDDEDQVDEQSAQAMKRQITLTTEELVGKLCTYCKEQTSRRRTKQKQNFDKCPDTGFGGSSLITVTSGRRRSSDCFAPSAGKSTTIHENGDQTFRTHSDRLKWGGSHNFNHRTGGNFVDARTATCTCLHKLLSLCDTQSWQCLQPHICDCPGVCPNFKAKLGCSSSLATRSSHGEKPSSAINISNTVDMDSALKGKCSV